MEQVRYWIIGAAIVLGMGGAYLLAPGLFFNPPPFRQNSNYLTVGDDQDEFKYELRGSTNLSGRIYSSLPLLGITKKAGAQRLLWILSEDDYQQYLRQYGRGGCPDSFLKPRVISVTALTADAQINRKLSGLSRGEQVSLSGSLVQLVSAKSGGRALLSPDLSPDDFNSRWILVDRLAGESSQH